MEFLAPLLLIAGILGLNGFKIDREYQRGVIFRLGRYQDTKGPGLYWIIENLGLKPRRSTTALLLNMSIVYEIYAKM
nr:hypothetical protein [Microcystis flos-aquae]